ncbi:hypothetical protein GCM10011594_25840 [Nakamurella endophytica]|uniref:Peptidase M15C domain-containing protein n=1 Tax=Nakamurella endophytica TaxID=1748367 RepID=A0A917SZZ4_9ACTN|nr:hypothetical protein GCM10011594_25840 [Nakamurella endophytica]
MLPPGGTAFAGRPAAPGVLHAGDAAVRAWTSLGWTWGGSWTDPRDTQHFSADGG